VVADHMPPARWQSAMLVIFERSDPAPGGLADGELLEPGAVVLPGVLLPGVLLPGVLLPGVLTPGPEPPVVPEGALEPEPGEPVPPPVCAVAIAGASAMMPTKSSSINFCTGYVLPLSELPSGRPAVNSNRAISGPSAGGTGRRGGAIRS
jgi:hypothetical protein